MRRHPCRRDGATASPLSKLAGFLLTLLLGVPLACGPSDPPPAGFSNPTLEAGPSVCPAGPNRPAGAVDPDYASIGPTSNAIRRGDNHLWIVESGSNTVSRLTLESGELERDAIDVGSDHNPYDIAIAPADDRAYVTNYMANTVTVADTDTGEVVDEITDDRFDNPTGIAVAGDRLYVTNVAFTGDGFDTGTIAVVDRKTREVSAVFESRWKNPQFARHIETPDGPRIAISDVGVLDRTGDNWGPKTPAGLELWDPSAKLDSPARQTWELGVDESNRAGAPGRALPTPDGETLYFTSATAPVLFKFDLRDRTWVRDAEEPIALYETDDNALHHGTIGPDGVLYVTSFNQDALYLFDTTCDERLGGPVDLGTSDELLEGPHGIAVEPGDETHLGYYIFSRANALGRIRLLARAADVP